jgi:hypothetical protein
MKKVLSLVLVAIMVFALTACGGGESSGSDNIIKIGDYEAVYKGSKLVKDDDGNDVIAITYDYTNNSKQAQSFNWAFYIDIKQGEKVLEYAPVFVSEDSFDMLDDAMGTDVNPGETLEVTTTYMLSDLTTQIDIKYSDLFDEKTDSLTIDMSTVGKSKIKK